MIRPRITPKRIANCNKFPEICSEECDPLRVICSKYFPSMNILLCTIFFNHLILPLDIT